MTAHFLNYKLFYKNQNGILYLSARRLVVLPEQGVQTVPEFPEVFWEIFRSVCANFSAAVDGGCERKHNTVFDIFRVIADKAIPRCKLAVVQQL